MKEEAEKRKLSVLKQNNINRKDQMVTSDTSFGSTKEKLAKMAGVGTGTIARYNVVMKSDDEEKLTYTMCNLDK